ncbi:MAG: Coenzyme F420 hydrogenase/dehydrogenase, beta subunit C-terminal domain [Bryobacteraceae bacterium]
MAPRSSRGRRNCACFFFQEHVGKAGCWARGITDGSVRSRNVVDQIAEAGLCSSCGVCAGICPEQALRMELTGGGDLRPVLAGRCLPGCRACLNVCSFSNGVYDPRPINERLYHDGREQAMKFHENIGWHLACAVGHVRSGSDRAAAASGGLATWCLQRLLKERLVDRVAVVKFAPARNGALFRFVAIEDPAEVAKASGSVYCPVDLSDVIREVLSKRDTRWALIGVPCVCGAVRQLRNVQARVPYLFGLACGMYQNSLYTEFLLAKSGVRKDDVSRITYRKKPETQPVSNYVFQARDRLGRQGRAIQYRGVPHFLGRHAHFRLDACNYCMDVFAESADATFMDAWLPEYANDTRGTSLVVLRSRVVQDLLDAGRAEGALALREIDSRHAASSQATHVRRKQELIRLRCKSAPVRNSGNSVSFLERLDWKLQRRTQRASRRAWTAIGRRFGPDAYWIVMLPLVVPGIVIAQCLRVQSRLARLLRCIPSPAVIKSR